MPLLGAWQFESPVSTDLPVEAGSSRASFGTVTSPNANDADWPGSSGAERSEQLIGARIAEESVFSERGFSEKDRRDIESFVRSGYRFGTCRDDAGGFMVGANDTCLRSQWGIVEEREMLQAVWGSNRDITS